MKIKILFVLIILIIISLNLTSCENSPGHFATTPSLPPSTSLTPPSQAKEADLSKSPIRFNEGGGGDVGRDDPGAPFDGGSFLYCKHTNLPEFYNSIQNPGDYNFNFDFNINEKIAGGIVPHHMVAATLVSGFFKSVSESCIYDTVIIVGPNHQGETGDIVVSFKNWQIWGTVYCDTDITENIYKKLPDIIGGNFNIFNIIESDEIMEEEHSISVLIPYINYYLPDSKVAMFLLSRRLSLESVNNFANILSDEINTAKESGKNILLVCSVDFSHFLTVSESIENDKITKSAIINRNYRTIHDFSNEYVDSPQSLNTFLMCFENMGINNIEILYNTDASEFLGDGIDQTTSYFIIAAY